MSQTFLAALIQIQPSQLYINTAKLAQIRARWSPPRLETLTPIPVVQLDGIIVATDGHTRAFTAYRAGFASVPVYWDTDDLSWRAYRICVGWCKDEGIRTVMDLEGRLLGPIDYQRLWLDRCQAMHQGLAHTGIS